jgi:YYY domain-containing protein
MNYVAYAIVWWLVLGVIGLIAFPLVSRICSKLPDKGYSISKLSGLLIMTYVSWILPSLHIMKFGLGVIILSLLILGALSFFLGRKQLKIDRSLLRSIIISEAVFTVAFVLFLVIISRKPDIYFAYSDDYVHFGFFNSILRSDYFPPKDPWFAGKGLEYYYGGHLTMATVTTLTRVPHVAAYEMAMPMTFALTIGAAYGLGYNITKRKLYGALAAFFVIVVGYISGAFELASYLSQHSIAGFQPAKNIGFVDWVLSFDFTRSNWIIPHAPNFYPYFSVLQGDMSPTTTVIPFQLLFISLAFALFKSRDRNSPMSRLDAVLHSFILALSLGFLLLAHTWSYPICLLFAVFVFLLVPKPLWMGVGSICLSLFLYIPYFIARGTGAVNGIGLVTDRTSAEDFTLIFALFMVVLVFLLLLLSKEVFFRKRFILAIIPIYLVIMLVAWKEHFPILLILLPMVLLAAYHIYKAKPKGEKEFVLLLLIMGALLGLAADIFFINDVYRPPYERMNTVMKLYVSLWVFWAVAAALAVYYILKSLKGAFRMVWVVLLVLLITGALVHPLLSTIGWSSGRQTVFGPTTGTLDGLRYLEETRPGDYNAIRWLNKNIHGSPVILEAPGNTNSYTSYVSALTGLPTVVGWKAWETVWRGDLVGPVQRGKDVDTIYSTTNIDIARSLLEKYNVEYIFFGAVELRRYGQAVLSKFNNHPHEYQLIYSSGQGVKIYKVVLAPALTSYP